MDPRGVLFGFIFKFDAMLKNAKDLEEPDFLLAPDFCLVQLEAAYKILCADWRLCGGDCSIMT